VVVPAPDTRSGHLTLAASAALALPFGSFAQGLPQTDVVGSGGGFGADLGIGVSHSVAIGAWGQLLDLSASDKCPDCSARSFAGGLFVRYYLVQGVRFDPWMSAGAGYRSTTLSLQTGDVTYSGFELLQVRVGGDWYPFPLLGLGPFMELDLGAYNSRPDDGRGLDLHWHFLVGTRLTLDIPGK
jgi:hypothetical protein